MPTDEEIRKAQAKRGLRDAWYLGSVILKLGQDEEAPRPKREVGPIYGWVSKPRPKEFDRKHGKQAKWKRLLCIPRYCAKTYIALVWLMQCILRNPDVRIAVHGNEKDAAAEAVGLLKEWFELPQVIELYGNHKSNFWSKYGFKSALRKVPHKDPTVRTIGLENPLEGKRCHIGVFDDLIGLNNNTPDGVLKVEKRIAAFMPLLMPGGTLLYNCTRWGPSDPASENNTFSGQPGILKKWATDGSWDAIGGRGYLGAYAKEGDEKLFPGVKPGDYLFPSVWNDETIAEARQEMVHGMFASQVLNEPRPEEARFFSQEDLQYFSERNPEDPTEQNPILSGGINLMSIDPASGEDQITRGDETVITVGRVKWVDNLPLLYVLRWVGGRWLSEKALTEAMNLVLTFKPKKFFVEINMGRGWLMGPLKRMFQENGLPLSILQEVKRTRNDGKNEWIEELSTAWAYRQIFLENHLKNSPGEDQTLRWSPAGADHDDWPDSLAILWHMATEKRWGRRSSRGWKVGSLIGQPRYRNVGV